jgi:hypothetical protein
MSLRKLAAGAGVTVIVGCLAGAGAAYGEVRKESVAFTVSDPRIGEASGLTVSRKHPGIVYLHNDSGDKPRIFAVGPDGRTRATLTLAGAHARDWEGIASGKDDAGRPALFVGDIGDNLGGAWPYVTVYRVTEPDELKDQTLRPTAFKFKYEDGPRNAESVMINPTTNRLYIVSKLFSGGVYEAPAKLRTGGYNKLHKIGGAPPIATDAAYAPDGRTYVIRTYFAANVYSKPGKLLRVISLPGEEQGEGITFTADGRSLLAASEGLRQPVYRVSLPDSALPENGAVAKTGKAVGHDKETGQNRTGLFLAIALGGALAVYIVRRRG